MHSKPRLRIKIVCLGIFCGGLLNTAYANNLGVMGALYPIAEADLLQLIQTYVAANQDNLQKQWQEKREQALDRPQPVGLTRTGHPRTWFLDPSVTLPSVVQDETGKITLPAHSVINPLEHYSLGEALIFYNADDASQVQWVQQMHKTLSNKCKLILVGGSVASQTQLFHKPIYFDQQGQLTARFQLRHVPTLITQAGKRLKISEIALP